MFEQRRQRNSDFYFLTSTSAKNRSLNGRDKSTSIVCFDQFNLMNSSVDQTSSNNRLLELCKSKIVWEDEGPVFYSELQKKMTFGHFFCVLQSQHCLVCQ